MEILGTIINYFDQWPAWVNALTALVTGATAITMLTPTTVDNAIVNFLLRALNVLSGNVVKNTNKDDPTENGL